jgi:hypothetical protein
MNEFQSLNTSRSRLMDLTLLVGGALLVCVVLVGSFLLAQQYHLDARWVFVGINSLGLIPIVGRRFKDGMPGRIYVPFITVWMILHGVLATFLILKVRVVYWLPIFAVEFALGFWIATRLSATSRLGSQE